MLTTGGAADAADAVLGHDEVDVGDDGSDWAKFTFAAKRRDVAWRRVFKLFTSNGVRAANLMQACCTCVVPCWCRHRSVAYTIQRWVWRVTASKVAGVPDADPHITTILKELDMLSLEQLLDRLPEIEEDVDKHYEAHIQFVVYFEMLVTLEAETRQAKAEGKFRDFLNWCHDQWSQGTAAARLIERLKLQVLVGDVNRLSLSVVWRWRESKRRRLRRVRAVWEEEQRKVAEVRAMG